MDNFQLQRKIIMLMMAIKSLYLQQTEQPNVILQAFPIYIKGKGLRKRGRMCNTGALAHQMH